MFSAKKMFRSLFDKCVGTAEPPVEVKQVNAVSKVETYEELNAAADEPTIVVSRTYYEKGTHGVVEFPSGRKLFTLERPWLDNQKGISCNPEGIYNMTMRMSAVVKRITKGRYTHGYEVTPVDGRTFLMWHPGSYVKNSDGCTLVGTAQDFQGRCPVIWKTQDAFDEFMAWMEEEGIKKVEYKSASGVPYELTAN